MSHRHETVIKLLPLYELMNKIYETSVNELQTIRGGLFPLL